MTDEPNISVSKIAATPSETSWSQAYNAGKLFAVISLSKAPVDEKKDFLNVLGKEAIETLEQEFFSLETKDLSSIKKTFEEALRKIPEDVESSFAAACIAKNIVYIFYFGNTRISIKRGEEFGVLIDSEEEKESGAISSLLLDGDIIILQTKQFKELVPTNVLVASIDSQPPEEIAETIAPIIHREEKGGAAAIILKHKLAKVVPEPEVVSPDIIQDEEEKSALPSKINISSFILPLAKMIKLPKFDKVNHTRKLILTVVLVIAALLVFTVVLSVRKQNEAKLSALFESVYTPATEKYKEGESLISLNKNLANDSFEEAYKILNENKSKFPKGSRQEKQILDLLNKTQQALSQTSGINTVQAKEETGESSSYLSEGGKNSSYVAQDKNNIYYVKNGVVSRDKGNNKEQTIIKSSDLPQGVGGLGIYNGNIYVLSKNDSQIFRFAGKDFTKGDYFSSSRPTLSNANAMTIDGAIWILFSDGNVAKYTRGVSDNLSITNLDKPLSNPSRIFTDPDTQNVYILDNGNSRIVVLGKNGEYQAQYQAAEFKNAKDFDVREADKKIYFLSNGKIYSINLE